MVAREMHDSVVSETGEQVHESQRPAGKAGLEGMRIADPGDVQHGSSASSPHKQDFLRLQRLYGNRAVSRALSRPATSSFPISSSFVQTKLTVGPANDPYEREADRVAETVTSQVSAGAAPPIQRVSIDEEEEMLQGKFLVRRQLEEEDELQLKSKTSRGGAGFVANADTAARLSRLRGNGSTLHAGFRSDIETKLGADFGQVRIHTGSEANSLTRSLSARAFTTGSDVFFADGQYDPFSASGKRLLAHELTHVVQQTGKQVSSSSTQSRGDGESVSQSISHADGQSVVQREFKMWEEMGMTEEEWQEKFQSTRKGIRQKLSGERELMEQEEEEEEELEEEEEELEEEEEELEEEETEGQRRRNDPEYWREQQEKHKPDPDQLKKLLLGAQMIRQTQKTPSPNTKKKSRWGKVKGFFSKLGRKKTDTIPKPPKAPTDEELSNVQQQLKVKNEQSLSGRLNKPKSLAEQLQEERRNRGMLPVSQPDSVGVGRAPEKMSRWGKVKSFFSRKKTNQEETPKKPGWDMTGGLKPRGYDPMEQTPAPKPKMLSTTVDETKPQKTDLTGGGMMGGLLGGLLGSLLGQKGGGGGGGGGGQVGLGDLPKTVQALAQRLSELEKKVNAL